MTSDNETPDTETSEGGEGLLALTTGLTVLLIPAVALMVWNPGGLGTIGAAAAVAMFAVGVVTNVWAFLIAVQRSRTEIISVGLLWFLPAGVASKSVRLRIHGATLAQLVIGVLGASLRPFTVAAFGVLACLAGLGLGGLWSARHGRFPPK